MTVLVAGTVEIKAGDRDKALADATALMADTRSQPGCRHYVWSADPTSDTRIYVYENWESSDALCAHLAGPFYAKMLGLLGSYEVHNVEVLKYKIALEEPVYDPEGKPRGDFFTE
jgi:quinol monooxygenase YgiN